MPSTKVGHGGIPDECQLCRTLGNRGDDINESTHTAEVAREDGGTKFVYACEDCLRGMGWMDRPSTIAEIERGDTDGE